MVLAQKQTCGSIEHKWGHKNESPKIKPYTYNQLIFNQDAKSMG